MGARTGHSILALGALGLATACGGSIDPAGTADRITRAVYANDLDATVANFDDRAKKDVSRSEVGAMSDKMHALGELKSLAVRSADADSGRYEYDATFSGGAMLVQLRLDPSGKVGAFRVAPEATPTASTPPHNA